MDTKRLVAGADLLLFEKMNTKRLVAGFNRWVLEGWLLTCFYFIRWVQEVGC